MTNLLRMALVAPLILGAPAAAAQDNESPFRFLRSWLGTSEQPAAPAASTPQPAPVAGAPAADTAATPDAAPAAEPAGVVTSLTPDTLPETTSSTSPPGMGGPDAGSPPDATPPSTALAPETPRPLEAPAALRLSVLAGRDPAATLSNLAPLAKGLADALGRSVEIVPAATFGAMIDAQASGRVDGGFYSATAFALAQARCACLVPLVTPAAADGTRTYRALVLVRKDSAIHALADLKGKRIAAGEADSVATRRMQIAGLDADGFVAKDSAELVDAGSGEEAVRRLMAGEVDAAFAWSSLSGDAATGFSRGTLTDLAGTGTDAASQPAILWQSPPIGHGPLALRASLSQAELGRIVDYFTALSGAEPALYDALNPLYGGGYGKASVDDYRGVAAMVAAEAEAAAPAP